MLYWDITEMNLLTYLIYMEHYVPFSTEKPCTRPTNSELRRWLDGGAVRINGVRTKSWRDLVDFPVTSLVFFLLPQRSA